jgi:hypothetical protein
MHDADGAGGYETPFGGAHIIYLGYSDSDLDFSMRDFYIDYTSGDLMNIDQAVMFKRNRF